MQPGSFVQKAVARPYQLVAYQSRWQADYQRYCDLLTTRLPLVFVSLDHIGSTSVTGLAAKPVIDILGSVPDIEVIDQHEDELIQAGYTALGEFGLPGRRYFVLETSGTRLVNLHIFATGSAEVARHLAFRDYLRAHAGAREEYERLKRRLFESNPTDLDAYMDGKDAWIKETERMALEWRLATADIGRIGRQ